MELNTIQESEEHGPMRVGVSLIKQLSTAFYADIANVFDELVSNAYDAGATHVKIVIKPHEISLEDDGIGMSSEELMRFFYISHTDKLDAKKYRHLGHLKRAIIGRFGIGKLSMYRLCRKFTITTWKDGVVSTSEFNFEDLEKLAFIDELNLSVRKAPVVQHGVEKHGTLLTLQDLKKKMNATVIRRHLSKTMPLKPDFKLTVNGIECAPEKLEGVMYNIEDELPGFGPVNGFLIYTHEPLHERDAGVYVRVAGRVVNHNPRIIELGHLRSALSLSRKTYMELNADWLYDAIKSDRTGFLTDNPKYIRLLDWLTPTLNKYNGIEMKRRGEEKEANEDGAVTHALRHRFSVMRTQEESSASPHSASVKVRDVEEEPEGMVRVDFQGKKFRIITISGSSTGQVWSISKDLILVNLSHPLATEARRRGCLDFHVLNIAIQAISRESSSTLEEEKINYEVLARQVCENK